MTKEKTTIDPAELEKFAKMADEWWDPHGKFKPLHMINPCRLEYISNTIKTYFKLDNELKVSLLDVGCGGGLVAENMALNGAKVTGVDALGKNINIAKAHAKKTGVELEYINSTAEAMVAKGKQFDVVLALEIVEHVDDVELFISSCCKLVKPGGLLFVSTMNKTLKSYAFAIIGAEYIMRWLPVGTHDWSKFLPPSEINKIVSRNNLTIKELKGMNLDLIQNKWKFDDNVDVNYMMCFEA